MKHVRKILLITVLPLPFFATQTDHSEFKKIVSEYLNTELKDATISQELTNIVCNTILTWQAPTIPVSEIDSIIAFAFGNRILPNGNRLPGPMNEALADAVVQLHQETNAPVYAQWEIAEAIGDRIARKKMTVIYPTLDAQANVIYLSTAGVLSEITKLVGTAKKLGKVAVIAFSDHIYRCIQLSHTVGVDAYAPLGYQMPATYDQHSGQPWTRDRFMYLITDIKARITNHFEKLMKSS